MSARKRKMIAKADKAFTRNQGCTFRELMRDYRFWKRYIKPIKLKEKCGFPSNNDLRRRKNFYCQGEECSWEDMYRLIGKEAMMHDYPYHFKDGKDIYPNICDLNTPLMR